MSKLHQSIFFTLLGVAVIFTGYQNCSRAHFTSDLDGAALKAESVPVDPLADRDPGDDGQVVNPPLGGTPTPPPNPSPNPSPSPETSPTPELPQDPTPSPTPPVVNNPPDPKNPPKPPKENSQSGDLVECQLLHPNKKIVLDYELKAQHSNASSVRVCMSRNACLQIINDFAKNHSCTLDASTPAAQADAQAQCTEIFPGSKGTCHNATVLTDQQVMDLLNK